MRKAGSGAPNRRRYTSISQSELPTGRKGKHNSIIHELLDELEKVATGQALRVALADLPDKKANIRSALIRATRRRGINVATSSDDTYFYMWLPNSKSKSG